MECKGQSDTRATTTVAMKYLSNVFDYIYTSAILPYLNKGAFTSPFPAYSRAIQKNFNTNLPPTAFKSCQGIYLAIENNSGSQSDCSEVRCRQLQLAAKWELYGKMDCRMCRNHVTHLFQKEFRLSASGMVSTQRRKGPWGIEWMNANQHVPIRLLKK